VGDEIIEEEWQKDIVDPLFSYDELKIDSSHPDLV